MITAHEESDFCLEHQVRILQIGTLYSHAPLQILATLIVVITTWLVMVDAAGRETVALWAAAQVASSGLLLGLIWMHSKATDDVRRLALGQAYAGGALFYGMAIGIGNFAMFVPGRLDLQMFQATILGTMCGTASGSHSAYRPVSLLFISGALLPFIVRLYLDGGQIQLLVAGAASSCLAAFLIATIHFNRRLAAGFRLQIENARLAAAMTATKERMSLALESIAEAFAMFDASNRLVLANSKYRDILRAVGLDPTRSGLTYAEVMQATRDAGMIAQAEGGPADYFAASPDGWRAQKEPVEVLSRDGRWVQISTRTTATGDFVVLITDITGVRGRAARLAVSEQRLRSIMDNVVEGILTTDANGRIESANRVIETMLGHGTRELVGQKLSVILPAAADPDFLASRLVPAKGRGNTEFNALGLAGSGLPVEINVGEMRIEGERKFIVVLRDIRERKAQQAQLTQSSKLASLGEIATGLGHELNQPLNIIRMAADSSLILMADGMADADFQRSQFGLISGQTVRMAKIIEHMRVFGRKDNADAVAFDPVDSARSALSLVQQQLRVADIDLEVDLPGECRTVQGYPLRLE